MICLWAVEPAGEMIWVAERGAGCAESSQCCRWPHGRRVTGVVTPPTEGVGIALSRVELDLDRKYLVIQNRRNGYAQLAAGTFDRNVFAGSEQSCSFRMYIAG
jgi:hypothetical protein